MEYLEGHKASGFKPGDVVRVTGIAESYQNGWECVWSQDMNETVGKTGMIDIDQNLSGFGVVIQYDSYSITWFYPYFVLEKVVNKGEEVLTLPGVNELARTLRELYPHGHEGFIPMTMAEMELHSTKNHDYAHGGKPTGNFDRVANILAQYPGLDISKPWNVATVYLLKQLDAALWLECKGHKAAVEGVDARWGDISVYSKIIRLLIKEGKGGSGV